MPKAGTPLRVLIVEDSEDDARLVLRELRRSGYEPVFVRVDTEAAVRKALADQPWELILSDYMMPGFGGLEALRIAKESGLDLPFILLSNKVSEETLVDAMRAGATDFLMKDRLSRLGPIVKRELTDAAARRAMKRAEVEWKAAFDSVHDAIFIHDADFRIVRANLAYAALGGMPIAQVIGKLYWEVFPKTGGPLSGRGAVRESGAPVEREFRLPTGEVYTSRSFPISDAHSPRLYSLHVLQDVTERNRVREALEKSERHYRKLIEGGSDVFLIIDPAGKLLYRSDSGKRLTGWDTKDVLGLGVETFVVPEDIPVARNAMAEALKHPERVARAEMRFRHKSGTQVDVEVTGRNFLDDPDVGGIVVTAHDITERLRAQEALRASRDLLSSVVENAPIRVFWKDLELRYLGCNSLFARDAGLSRPEDLIGKDDFQMGWRDQAESYRAGDRQVIDTDTPIMGFEEPQTTPDGRMIWLRTSKVPLHDVHGKPIGVLGIYDDITERKRTEQAVNEEKARAQHYLDIAGAMLLAIDKDRKVSLLNRRGREVLGYGEEEIIGKDWVDNFVPQHARDEVGSVFVKLMAGKDGALRYQENHVLTKDGRERLVAWHNTVLKDADGRIVGTLSSGEDITERKRAEKDLLRLNWALLALGQSNSALVHAGSEQELFQACCDAIAGAKGYPLAWIGLVHDDAGRSVEITAASGVRVKYVDDLRVTWDDSPLGRGPTGTAIRTGKTQVVNDFEQSALFVPWLQRAREYGLRSVICVPILNDAAVVGALVVYGGETGMFGQPEIKLFEELAADIGYGVASRRTLSERDQLQQEQLRSAEMTKLALIGTIEAVALTVEKRDPYTAGHQQRVAQLCVAISRKLGLSEDRVVGMRLGALIHDIGKIYVPADILSRPGKLSKPEFEIIKAHPQVGYDIIKGVKFPWPIAEMVLQHHERLDGSGYPQGLKGEQIILKARILAVADTVEAMTSHRPYRPGLGIEKALAEIERGRGSAYDPAVVDACVELFRNKEFSWE